MTVVVAVIVDAGDGDDAHYATMISSGGDSRGAVLREGWGVLVWNHQWEVITCKQPYAGNNFISVTLEVLDGHRPSIPNNWQS